MDHFTYVHILLFPVVILCFSNYGDNDHDCLLYIFMVYCLIKGITPTTITITIIKQQTTLSIDRIVPFVRSIHRSIDRTLPILQLCIQKDANVNNTDSDNNEDNACNNDGRQVVGWWLVATSIYRNRKQQH